MRTDLPVSDNSVELSGTSGTAAWKGAGLERPVASSDQARSKRSSFMTLSHAATKSRTNFSFESSHA